MGAKEPVWNSDMASFLWKVLSVLANYFAFMGWLSDKNVCKSIGFSRNMNMSYYIIEKAFAYICVM